MGRLIGKYMLLIYEFINLLQNNSEWFIPMLGNWHPFKMAHGFEV